MHLNQKISPSDIQDASINDCSSIARLQVKTWQYAYCDIFPESYLASLSISEREVIWSRKIEQRSAHLLIARIAEEIVGFVAFAASRDEDSPIDRAEILAIYVAPDSWSKGIGQALLTSAQREMITVGYTSVSLWVLAENEKAQRFYERAGFIPAPSSRKSFELGGVEIEELRYLHTRLR